MHSKVDFGRYVVLYNYGGISVDTDMVSLRPIRDTPGLEDSEFFISELSYPGNLIGLKNNAVILCVSKHPIMKECIERIIKDKRLPSEYKLKEQYVNETTGPIFIGGVVAEYKDSVKTMDYTYYEPCSPKDPYCEIPDKAIMDHQHELSWTSGTYQFLIWLMYFILHYFWVLLIVGIVVVYLYFTYFRKLKLWKISK
jgi:mannosyltransferase OCH1-like enzyme